MMFRAIVLVLILASPVFSADRRVSLRGVLDIALRKARVARDIELNYKRSFAEFKKARSDYAPSFTLTAADNGDKSASVTKKLKKSGSLTMTADYDNDTSSDQKSLQFEHPLFRTNEAGLDLARIEWALAGLEKARRMVDLRFEVIRGYYEVLRGQERVKVNVNAVERWKKLLEFAKVRLELGSSTKIDVLNAQINLGTAENALLAEEQSLAARRDRLADLVGLDPCVRLVATEKVEFSPVLKKVSDKWLREDVEIARLQVEKARILSRESRRNARPDVTLTSQWIDSDASGEDFSSLVSWSFQFGRRPDQWLYDTRRCDERLARIALERQEATALLEQLDVRRKIKRLERSIAIAGVNLKRADESVEFSQFSFEKGMISAIELRESQDKLTQARSAYVNLLIDYRIAAYEFEKSFGGDLE